MILFKLLSLLLVFLRNYTELLLATHLRYDKIKRSGNNEGEKGDRVFEESECWNWGKQIIKRFYEYIIFWFVVLCNMLIIYIRYTYEKIYNLLNLIYKILIDYPSKTKPPSEDLCIASNDICSLLENDHLSYKNQINQTILLLWCFTLTFDDRWLH